MSKKNRILSLFLGVLICLNVSLCNYKNTYAFIGESAALSSFVQAFFQTFYFNLPSNAEEWDGFSREILTESENFIEYLQSYHPVLYQGLNSSLNTFSLYGDFADGYKLGAFSIPHSLISGLFSAAQGYLAVKGAFNSEAGTYSFEHESSSGSLDSSGETYTTDINDVISFLTNDVRSARGSAFYIHKDYYPIATRPADTFMYFEGGPDIWGKYIFRSCDIDGNSLGVIVVTENGNGNSVMGDWSLDWFERTPVRIGFAPDSSLFPESVNDDIEYGPSIPTNFNLSDLAAAQSAFDTFTDTHSAVVSDHASDGIVTNERYTTYQAVFQEQTNSETGETEYVPVPLNTAVDLGWTVDNSFAKPTETTITHPAVDAETGENVKVGAVTGSVSITGFGETALDGLKSVIRTLLLPIQAALDALNSVFSGFWSLLEALLTKVFCADLIEFKAVASQLKSTFTLGNQLHALWTQLLNHSFDPQEAPKFSFNLPSLFFKDGTYVDKECLVVDFTTFMQWRTFLDNIIVLLAWLAFAKRMYSIIPSLFGYAASGSSQHYPVTRANVSPTSHSDWDRTVNNFINLN